MIAIDAPTSIPIEYGNPPCPEPPTPALTSLLNRLTTGDRSAEADLMRTTYPELKRLAVAYLRNERHGHTLQPTALVHEAYLKMRGQCVSQCQDRTHFFALAAKIMRRILTDHGRYHRALKRGAGSTGLQLDQVQLSTAAGGATMFDLDAALTRLAVFAPRQAKVVELRFYGGLTEDEIATHLEVCTRTVKRDWLIAKAWLYNELAS